MNLRDLLLDTGLRFEARGRLDRDVPAISSDSRRVAAGGAFVAMRARDVDGHPHVPAALEAGAGVIVAEIPPPADLDPRVTWVRVDRTSEALGLLAAALHGHPSRILHVLAVTGTNGKTTVTWLLAQILRAAGYAPGVVGTVEVRYGDVRKKTPFTTPTADLLQEILAEMRDAGCTHAVLEASSHGLEQGRLGGVVLEVGGFTNLTRDHIDYHGTMEEYGRAKARLFEGMARAAAFNVDDPFGRALAASFEGPRRTSSTEGREADLAPRDLRLDLEGAHGKLGDADLRLPLLGRHNVENALVALGMAELAGVPREVGLRALARAEAAPGRLETVPGPRRVVVDYAHSPDALENVLGALRPLVPGRLICVFGAGGDRDRGKRPEMGRVVAERADLAVVTSDNPRTEDPAAILADILAGVPDGADRIVEPDRRRAIEKALAASGPADLVLIAGKGHEDYQIVGDRRLDFDDRKVARELMEALA